MDSSGEDLVVRRRSTRCVQSKLSFSVSPQASCPQSAAATSNVETEDGESDSEGKKINVKRKRIKPQYADNDKAAKELSGHRKYSGNRKLKSKQSGGETPRKNRTPIRFGHAQSSLKRMLNCNSENIKDCDDDTRSVCDLWSEAKKAAEENLRLSAGKETHPFFSICKSTKRLSETKPSQKAEHPSWLSLEVDCCISLPPIHVFDTVTDDVAVPNWNNWSFLETNLQKINDYCSIEVSSVFVDSTEFLNLGVACGNKTKLDCILADQKMDDTCKSANLFVLTCDPFSKEQLSSRVDAVHAFCNRSCSSTQRSRIEENKDKLHEGRLASYYQRCLCCSDCCLWTEKYRPESSLEVCGNTESVKILSDWLKTWQEKCVLNNTNENSGSRIEVREDSSYYEESDMDEQHDVDSLKNVLLITGPAGCGKSAAIYACAKEQGFKVIEVNTSSLRSGAYMRQTFGEGVDSLGLRHWVAEDQTLQQNKDIQELQSGISFIAQNELETHPVKLASKCHNFENATGESSHFHFANKTLILFEEVDVVFDEDKGFVSMILKLAETAKRPIILTSNTKQPDLPHHLDRLVVDFTAPSFSELLYHTSMVCAFEKINISFSLLEHIINSCVGDIRKILMLLQFWCQDFQGITGKTIQCSKCLVPFDFAAAHLAIPKVIPWEFRCELSEKVEEEVSKAVSAMEENSIIKIFAQSNISSMDIIDPSHKVKTLSAIKGRKKGKLRRHSIIAHTEFSDHMNHLQDLSDDLDSPPSCFQRTSKRKCHVVLSSQSDDGSSSDELKTRYISENEADLSSDELKLKYISDNDAELSSDKLNSEDTSVQSSGYNLRVFATFHTSPNQEIYGPSQFYQTDKSRTVFTFQNNFDISEAASTSHVCDSIRKQDVSCMSELSSFCGIETNPKFTLTSHGTFDSNSPHILPGVDMNTADGNTELNKCLDVHAEFIRGNPEILSLQTEEHGSNQWQFVDSDVCSQEIASIPKMWRRLRSCDENIKLLSPNSKDVSLVTNLTSGFTDLISEADILFSSCNPIICDYLEAESTPCNEPGSFSWYDDQVEMGSTIAQHGVFFYTMKFASVGSCLGCNNTSDLAQEMLTSGTNSTAIGRLIIQESIAGRSMCFQDSYVKKMQSLMLLGRDSVPDLYSAILPIVPARLSMALKSTAFHEYLSFVSQISRFECSRLAESLVDKQKRRPRVRMHYLSSGEHQLSSQQAELLAQRCYFTRSNSIDKGNTRTCN